MLHTHQKFCDQLVFVNAFFPKHLYVTSKRQSKNICYCLSTGVGCNIDVIFYPLSALLLPKKPIAIAFILLLCAKSCLEKNISSLTFCVFIANQVRLRKNTKNLLVDSTEFAQENTNATCLYFLF
ncbi:hypothetical protein ACQJBY_007326 [Aegilops geniculata]